MEWISPNVQRFNVVWVHTMRKLVFMVIVNNLVPLFLYFEAFCCYCALSLLYIQNLGLCLRWVFTPNSSLFFLFSSFLSFFLTPNIWFGVFIAKYISLLAFLQFTRSIHNTCQEIFFDLFFASAIERTWLINSLE